MAIFNNPTASADMTIDLHRFHVWVRRIKGPGQWENWYPDGRLKVLSIFKGSSFGGPSYAKLQVAVGQPFDDDEQYIEHVDALYPGDRVAIGNGPPGNITWLFCGYCTQGQVEIRDGHEAMIFNVFGPEWFWGIHPGSGFDLVVEGQARRTSDGDEQWMANTDTLTEYAGWDLYLDEIAVFNPDGRRNMTSADVRLSPAEAALIVTGRIWETPDRTRLETLVAEHWTMREAVKALLMIFNAEADSGIQNPAKWEEVLIPTDRLAATDVDGLNLWQALHKVMSPSWGFFVDPAPLKAPNRDNWGPFAVNFYARGSGQDVPLYLNELNTPMHRAIKCVARLNVTKDASKVANEISVIGKALRPIKLLYHGSRTTALDDAGKKTALQHGWKTADGDLAAFQTGNAIDEQIVEGKGAELAAQWEDRYTTRGREHARYAHVFRLFTWNEAAELRGAGPTYAGTAQDWFAPNLGGIADDSGFVDAPLGTWYRRRRRLLDTQYMAQGNPDAWRRVQPILLMQAAGVGDDTKLSKWIRISPGGYRVDPERAAIWIKAEDLAMWRPFKEQPDPESPELPDGRTFATLLLTGKLRMMLETTIEIDHPLIMTAGRLSTSGSKLVRRAVLRNPVDFMKSIPYDDGIASPTGLSAQQIDTSADALALATRCRAAGQDMQVHASILVELDWPEIPIGAMINRIEGRGNGIDLRGGVGGTGAGAQVVAKVIDVEACKWEYLTESSAMQLRDVDRMRLVDRRRPRRPGEFPPLRDGDDNGGK